MDPKDKTVDWQRLVITTLLIVIASTITSSITWFILDRTFDDTQDTNAELVSNLEKKITYLGSRISEVDSGTMSIIQNGSISGSISYPSSGIPTKTKIFAENTKTGKVYESIVTFSDPTKDMSATATYVASVPEGSYYVYGTIADFNDQNGTLWKAYYNQFVICGMAASCKDVTKVTVSVASAGKVENVTIGDWYPTK
jgi:hypothetical protein